MSQQAPVVSPGYYRRASGRPRLSAHRWRAAALHQQRLRWAECGRRIAARMDAAGCRGEPLLEDRAPVGVAVQ